VKRKEGRRREEPETVGGLGEQGREGKKKKKSFGTRQIVHFVY
jgi:hypothetical protein